MNKNRLVLLLLLLPLWASAQFHTLKIPALSNKVEETQRLAVTDICIAYHSPSVNGRNVWSDPNVIPQNGDPIPWRAGANMNTTITFSTDVLVEGKLLAAGTYGFHIIPKDNNTYVLLFAHQHNQWGSYYLDQDKDVSLSVEVKGEESGFSEKLDYEFLNWKENSVVIGLEWGGKRIPFSITVDLNKTVVESFRSELRGINTYHWQAWNDAANWCLAHDTNLEEALEWAERSIAGGFGGFAADKNAQNLMTKVRLLNKLNRRNGLDIAIDEIVALSTTPNEVNNFAMMLLAMEMPQKAVAVSENALKTFPDAWFLRINKAVGHYFLKEKSKAFEELESVIPGAPERFKPRLLEIKKEMEEDRYVLPQR